MVKAIVLVVLLAVGGLIAAYFGGGFSSYDPAEVGKTARAGIRPGMTWNQVLNLAEPGNYKSIYMQKKKVNGEEVEIPDYSGPRKFDRPLFEQEMANKTMPDGFAFVYVFTQQVAFDVHFDGGGRVTDVEDTKTMADLLQTRENND